MGNPFITNTESKMLALSYLIIHPNGSIQNGVDFPAILSGQEEMSTFSEMQSLSEFLSILPGQESIPKAHTPQHVGVNPGMPEGVGLNSSQSFPTKLLLSLLPEGAGCCRHAWRWSPLHSEFFNDIIYLFIILLLFIIN